MFPLQSLRPCKVIISYIIFSSAVRFTGLEEAQAKGYLNHHPNQKLVQNDDSYAIVNPDKQVTFKSGVPFQETVAGRQVSTCVFYCDQVKVKSFTFIKNYVYFVDTSIIIKMYVTRTYIHTRTYIYEMMGVIKWIFQNIEIILSVICIPHIHAMYL